MCDMVNCGRVRCDVVFCARLIKVEYATNVCVSCVLSTSPFLDPITRHTTTSWSLCVY